MTLKELSQLYYLKREIQRDTQRLLELERMRVAIPGPKLDGLPRANKLPESNVERLVADIVDLQAIIESKQAQSIHERARLERYIAGIDDSMTRQIFSCRFVDGLSWNAVADALGGGNTDESVKKTCYRYLLRHP